MINEKLNRIEKEIQEIKRMTNTEYFKKVEEQCERVNNAYDYIYKLNKEYKDRIDKAIEYINTHSEMTDFQIYGIENTLYFRGSVEKLLDILKGSDNNE